MFGKIKQDSQSNRNKQTRTRASPMLMKRPPHKGADTMAETWWRVPIFASSPTLSPIIAVETERGETTPTES